MIKNHTEMIRYHSSFFLIYKSHLFCPFNSIIIISPERSPLMGIDVPNPQASRSHNLNKVIAPNCCRPTDPSSVDATRKVFKSMFHNKHKSNKVTIKDKWTHKQANTYPNNLETKFQTVPPPNGTLGKQIALYVSPFCQIKVNHNTSITL